MEHTERQPIAFNVVFKELIVLIKTETTDKSSKPPSNKVQEV
jgi:hypothetical protein